MSKKPHQVRGGVSDSTSTPIQARIPDEDKQDFKHAAEDLRISQRMLAAELFRWVARCYRNNEIEKIARSGVRVPSWYE